MNPRSILSTGAAVNLTKAPTQIDDSSILPTNQRSIYSAKIDYVTLQTSRKLELPAIRGRAIWPRRHNNRRVTIHDATPMDLVALYNRLGDLVILELEVAVDLRAAEPNHANAPEMLKSIMIDQVAKQLEPSKGRGMKNRSRSFYRRLDLGYVVSPFNKRLPRSSDQQLHAWRYDPVQVKSYLKKVDQHHALHESQHVARVEVRLGSAGLALHGLHSLDDLLSFKYRKRLMPYFSHVGSVVRDRKHPTQPGASLLQVLQAKQSEIDQTHFDRAGIGAFLKGGNRADANVRFKRNNQINNRFGQALHRLEKQMAHAKSCVLSPPPAGDSEHPCGLQLD
jgi:hypothetical protein